jgi:hypothetical protein
LIPTFNIQASQPANTPTNNIQESQPENIPTPENDNWLEKEDELIAAKEEAVTENPIPQEIVKQNFKVESEALNIFEESWEENQTKDQTLEAPIQQIEAPIQQIETPIQQIDSSMPTNTLEDDHAIIEKLQNSIEPESKSETAISQPSGNEVNLDDIIITPATTTPTMNQIEIETWIHGYQVPKTPTETESFLPTKIQNNKKLLPYIGGILLTLLVVFVLRKQYPLEFQNMLGNKQNIENPLPQEIEEPSINEDDEEIPEEIPEENLTEEIPEENLTEETPIESNASWSKENNDVNPSLANYHPAAENDNENFEAFEDLEAILDEEQRNKEKVLDYKEEGKRYIVIGIKTKDKEVEKYGRFLFVRTEEILEKIEKGTEITTDDLKELEEYLQKLTQLSSNDRSGSLSQQTTPSEEEFSANQNDWETY